MRPPGRQESNKDAQRGIAVWQTRSTPWPREKEIRGNGLVGIDLTVTMYLEDVHDLSCVLGYMYTSTQIVWTMMPVSKCQVVGLGETHSA